MQISPLAGQYSSVTLTPSQPANRQVEEVNASPASQSSPQKTGELGQLPAVLPFNPTENKGDINNSLAARRSAYEVSLVDSVKPDMVRARVNTGQFANQAAFKAVSEYRDVASQEQREELTEVLGIDVFA